MTVYEKIKTLNIEELTEAISKHGEFEDSPWLDWWIDNYCSKCESIETYIPDHDSEYEWNTVMEQCYCELNDICRFFPEAGENSLSNEFMVRSWLESKYNEKGE